MYVKVTKITESIFNFVPSSKNARNHCPSNFPIINIGSGSEANMTTSCEMELFNFLWLIRDYYLPLAPTKNDRPP